MKRKGTRIAFLIAIVILAIYYFGFAYPFRGVPFNATRHGNPPLTPPWALECWLWEDDCNTAGRVDTLLDGYAFHDIPVRTILLDSPWSTRYNDFEFDTILYPEPSKWFAGLQERGYRVVLWMTSMVNSRSNDTRFRDSDDWFNATASKGFLATNGRQIKWWKGKGGFIDYTDPDAMEWWHGLQQKAFGYGIDGWKLDGTGTLFRTMAGPLPLFYGKTDNGVITTRSYMDLYYRSEYAHGLTLNPEFVTLARAIDRGYHPEGFAPVDAAPVTWVGDQKHTWESAGSDNKSSDKQVDIALDGIDGIEMAINNILRSASLGYNIIGSDIAGFSGRDIPPRLYIRWAEFSAFCGLFLNGGHGERALWKRSRQELEIIRKFSWLHTEMIPYMYTYVVNGHNGGAILQRPLKDNYGYMFGDYLMVTPIYKDELTRKINLPEGRWRYLFDDKEVLEGSKSFVRDFPLDEFPVFVREGAIIPMDVRRGYTGFGDSASAGFLTMLIWPDGNNTFRIHHPDRSGSTLVEVSDMADRIVISLGEVHKPHILRINLDKIPGKVILDDSVLEERKDWIFDPGSRKLVIKTLSYSNGKYTVYK